MSDTFQLNGVSNSRSRRLTLEDIQIWSINGNEATELNQASQMESENLLENVLVNNPSLLMDDLILVGRQTPTDSGPLDLLGVDGDGRLVVFELKRGTLSRDAVAQVIDYTSDLDSMELEDLASHVSERSGEHGIEKIDDFQGWYSDRGFEDLESLKPLRMFLVGLGVDDTTERMVEFLAKSSNMDISLLTFHGFAYNGETILAKQVEVTGSSDEDDKTDGKGLSPEERRDVLIARINRFEIRKLFDDVADMFRESWPQSRQSITKTGLGIRLPIYPDSEKFRGYGRVKAEKNGKVRMYLYERAFRLGTDDLRQTIDEIPFQTTPRGRDPFEDKDVSSWEFPLTTGEWDTHKERLTALTQAVYAAWENSAAGE